jgi:hypothetical protein
MILNASRFLNQFDDIASAISNNDAAEQLNAAKLSLLATISEQEHRAT